MQVSATEVQNNFGKYLKLCKYEDIIITKNGKKIARLTTYTDNIDTYFIREASERFSAFSGRKISYKDFLEISQKSELRYEYIDGKIYLLASPNYAHQKAVREIFGEFTLWFRDKECEPLDSPFDVTLTKKVSDEITRMSTDDIISELESEEKNEPENSKDNIHVVQPDIIVICDKENIDEEGIYRGIPSLVVEVLSPSTKEKDLIEKLRLYLLSGIREYWIVNVFSKEILIYSFKNYRVDKMVTYKSGEKAQSIIFEGLSVDVDRVF
ncbi:MAG TPA: type II toxin-antitoxin system Phd/YefM family antitoxin [Clostridiaceae bacterium]|nr:type II toxin-antitoxin system Phd/YefM family antitoxin [Clostridiaceae bacterium]